MFRRRNLTLLIGTTILGLAVVIGAMPAETDGMTDSRERSTRTVRVAAVEQMASTRIVRFPGVTRSVDQAALAFTIPARVSSRPVEVGDRVRAGQVVARLDTREYELAQRSAAAVLAELDVRLEQARRDEARVKQLADAKAATTEELEKVQAGTATLAAAHEAAAARLEDTTRLLDETTLRAPFDGTVTRVKIDSGEWASPGKTVVELSGVGNIELQIEVPESMRSRITPGASVQVDLPMSGRSVTGKVSSVSDASAGAGSLYPVVITLEGSEGVIAGMTAEANLPLDTSSELTVPLAAVLDSGSSQPSVFRVEDGVASRVAISPGQVVGDRLTVTASELDEGDMVAVVGQTALVDGDQVEVR